MTQVILASDVETTHDTFGRSDLPATPAGVFSIVAFGKTGSTRYHPFMSIDPTAKIASNMIVNSASLFLYMPTQFVSPDQYVQWWTLDGAIDEDVATWIKQNGGDWSIQGGDFVTLITSWLSPTSEGWYEIPGFGPTLQTAVSESRPYYFGGTTTHAPEPISYIIFHAKEEANPWYIQVDVSSPKHPHYYTRRRRCH